MHQGGFSYSVALAPAKFLIIFEALLAVLSERPEFAQLEPSSEGQQRLHSETPHFSRDSGANGSRSLQITSKVALISLSSETSGKSDEAASLPEPAPSQSGASDHTVSYVQGTIRMADYFLGNDNVYLAEYQAEEACDARGLQCKGYWQSTSGKFRLLEDGTRTWKANHPDTTVKMVMKKQVCKPGEGCKSAKADAEYLDNLHRDYTEEKMKAEEVPQGTIKDIDHEKLLEFLPQLGHFQDSLIKHFRSKNSDECAEFDRGDPSFSSFDESDKYGCGWMPPGNDRSSMHVKDKLLPACRCSPVQLCEQPGVDEFMYAYQNSDHESAVQVGKLYMAGRCYYPVKKPFLMGVVIAIAVFSGLFTSCSVYVRANEDHHIKSEDSKTEGAEQSEVSSHDDVTF